MVLSAATHPLESVDKACWRGDVADRNGFSVVGSLNGHCVWMHPNILCYFRCPLQTQRKLSPSLRVGVSYCYGQTAKKGSHRRILVQQLKPATLRLFHASPETWELQRRTRAPGSWPAESLASRPAGGRIGL